MVKRPAPAIHTPAHLFASAVMNKPAQRGGSGLVASFGGGEAAETLAAAQRIAKLGSWEWDLQADSLRWSEQLFEILGVPKNTAPHYDAYMARVHPDDRERMLEDLRLSMLSQPELDHEYRLVLPGGVVKMVHAQGVWTRDEEGRAVRLAGTVHDITERWRAAEALRVSEERFRSLVRVTTAVSWWTDATGQITEATPSWTDFTGMSLDEVLQPDGWFTAVHPDDRARAVAAWERAAASGTEYYNEYRLRRHDGVWRNMIVRGAPIRKADGTVREWIGSCVDVTDFKTADDAARFRGSLLDATGESIIATDPAGRIVYINQFAAAQFGWSVEEAIGANIIDVTVPMTSREQAEEIMDQLRRGETWTGEFIAHRRDGRLFPIRASNTPVFDPAGKLVAIIGVARDVTERHASEQALRQSEERYRAAFDQAAVGVAQIAFDGTFQRVNPRLCDLLGYSADELSRLKFSDLTHPEDLARSVQLMGEVLEHQREYFAVAKRYICKAGHVIWASSTVSLMRDREGNPQSLIAIVEDISAQKDAELALVVREAELRALTARLNAAREDEARRIARELHDELGQVLTAITLETADAQRRLAERDGSTAVEIQRHLTSVRKLVDQAIGTTRRVCTELRPALLDQVGFVPALEWQAHDFEARSGIFCSLKLPDPPPEIGGELATALFRIFQEVLTNVARHSEATEVTVDLTSNETEIRLTVHDNGRGLTHAQASRTSGLGLIGIRERTLGVGGTVSFEGKDGHGTRVSIAVPLPAGNAETN